MSSNFNLFREVLSLALKEASNRSYQKATMSSNHLYTRLPTIIYGVPIHYVILFTVELIIIAALADKGYDITDTHATIKQKARVHLVLLPIHLAFGCMIIRVMNIFFRYSGETVNLPNYMFNLGKMKPLDIKRADFIPLTLECLSKEAILNGKPALWFFIMYFEVFLIPMNFQTPVEHRVSWFVILIPMFVICAWMAAESIVCDNWFGKDIRDVLFAFHRRYNELKAMSQDMDDDDDDDEDAQSDGGEGVGSNKHEKEKVGEIDANIIQSVLISVQKLEEKINSLQLNVAAITPAAANKENTSVTDDSNNKNNDTIV